MKIILFIKKHFRYFWVLSIIYTYLQTAISYFRIAPVRLFRDLRWFLLSLRKYNLLKSNPAFSHPEKYLYPCLTDNTVGTPIEPIYFYQNSWAAGKLFGLKPKKHVDVGSSASAIGIISQFVPTTMVDIRPLPVKLANLTFVKGSILKLPFKDKSLETISSICVVEHIGLGRYGDKLDQFGSEKAIKELKRVVKKGGYLIITVPVDTENRIYFNARRAFTRDYILTLFEDCRLVEEKYIYGFDFQNTYDSSLGFGTGLYLFKKR
ncbi:MAG: DUF268 domain-containing protein [bacterium]